MPSRSITVPSAGGCIENQIHDMIIQQIDFIHIEYSPMGFGQESRLDLAPAGAQGLLKVNPSGHTVLGGVKGQGHHAYPALNCVTLPAA